MTTLNARAHQAWVGGVADHPTDDNAGFSHQRAAYEEGYETGAKAAVHEAYVNAQRAVTAIGWGIGFEDYLHGRESMQEDAVRAIREAAEENR